MHDLKRVEFLMNNELKFILSLNHSNVNVLTGIQNAAELPGSSNVLVIISLCQTA